MKGLNVVLEFELIFPTEDVTISQLLIGIPKVVLLKFGTTFLMKDLVDGNPLTLENINGTWLNSNNYGFFLMLRGAIFKEYGNNNSSITLIHPLGYLRILEYALQIKEEVDNVKDNDTIETDLFKVMLLINSEFVKNQKLGKEYILEKYNNSILLPLMTLTATLSTADLTSFNFKRELNCQVIKAFYLFDYLYKDSALREHLKVLMANYKLTKIMDHFNLIIPLIKTIVNKNDEGKIQIELDINRPDYEITLAQLNALSKQEYGNEKDIDFIAIRSQPLILLSESKFLISHPLFVFDKIYKGLFFELSSINNDLPSSISPFRPYFTLNFSEKTLFYSLIREVFGNKYIQYSGEELKLEGNEGTPDYYVRNGNIIYILENKDVLLNATVKENPSFEKIDKEIEKKFFMESGLKQIARNTMNILRQSNNYDKGYQRDKVIVYPLLVVHDLAYDCAGLNHFFNHKFDAILKSLEIKEAELLRVKPLIILHIDVLIFSIRGIKSFKFKFRELLDHFLKVYLMAYKDKSLEKYEKRRVESFYPASKILWNFIDDISEDLLNMPNIKSLQAEIAYFDHQLEM